MNILSDQQDRLRDEEEAAFVGQSLLRHHKGNAQLVYDSLADFRKDAEVKAVLEQYRALQQQLYARWRALGYGEEIETVNLEAEVPVVEAGGEVDAEGDRVREPAGEVDANGDQVREPAGEVDANGDQVREPAGEVESQEVKLDSELEDQIDALTGEVESQVGELISQLEDQMAELGGKLESQVGELIGQLEDQMGEPGGEVESQDGTPPPPENWSPKSNVVFGGLESTEEDAKPNIDLEAQSPSLEAETPDPEENPSPERKVSEDGLPLVIELDPTDTSEQNDSHEPASLPSEVHLSLEADSEAASVPNESPENMDHSQSAETPSDPILIPKRMRLDFPNGKVGTPYHFAIPLEALKIDPERVTEVVPKGVEAAGLQFNPEEWTLHGTPAEQGQFDLELEIHYLQGEDRQGLLFLEGNCNINPDPRSLWQEHEPPADAPFPKTHTDSGRVETAEAILLGASRRGRAHAHKGSFRDDDFSLAFDADSGWHILAVADGAGSAKYSREGSRLAVEIAQKRLQELLDADFNAGLAPLLSSWASTQEPQTEQTIRLQLYDTLVGAVFDAYKGILASADQEQVATRDYSTTLLLTICRPFPEGWFMASYWVGDGCIAVYRAGESVEVLGNPDSGEFAGQTRFLTMKELWQDSQTILNRLHLTLVPDFTGLVLMTDGISDPKFQTDYNLRQVPRWEEFWADLHQEVDLRHPEAEAQLLEWLNFWSQGDHDDRTLAFLLPQNQEAEA